ncbi:MAG: DUF3034 family protein [Burkholderiaceae bacterium]
MAGSRLVATGGVSQIEGAAGGGLTPWAVIAGYGTADEIGGSGYVTRAHTDDGFGLSSVGIAIGLYNRVELSAARVRLGLGTTVPGQHVRMNVFGLKVRLFGDAVYDQDSWWPQVSIGLQHKRHTDFDFIPRLLGAHRGNGTDLYVSATKVWLAGLAGRNVVTSLTIRSTAANQYGLLGFSGPRGGRTIVPEVSTAVFLNDRLLMGAEYRKKPDLLASFGEESAIDVFATWFIHRSINVTLAFLDLGRIADKPDQKAWYLSVSVDY